MLLFTSKTVAH